MCHHNTIFIYKSLSTPTLDRFYAVTHVSTAMSLFCCLLMAVSGYLVFTSKTEVGSGRRLGVVDDGVTGKWRLTQST